MIAINIGLLGWVIAAAFAVGWFSSYLCRDRPVKNISSDNDVVPDPDYAEWYIQHRAYNGGKNSYTIYKRPEEAGYLPWEYGTFESFDAAMEKLNELKAKHEANKVKSIRNYIVR